MKKLKHFLSRYGWTIGTFLVAAFVLFVLFAFGTKSFLPGFSPAEVQAIQQSKNIHNIISNPLWLPYKIALYGWSLLGSSPYTLRYVSGLFAVLALFSFYSLAKRWYSTRVSVLTVCLFGLSSTTLTVGRIATPAIMLYSWVLFIAAISWFRISRKVRFAPPLMLISTAFVLYIPGTFWLVALLMVWFSRDIPHIFKHMQRGAILIGGATALLLLLPLFYAFYADSSLVREWLLLPHKFYLNDSIRMIRDIPAAFFYRSNMTAAYNLGRLPFFDAFSGTMFLLGLYAYRKKIRLQRTMVYTIAIITGVVLTTINNNQLYLLFILPFMYLLIGEGLSLLLNEWRYVFPRNPVARFIGTLLLSVAVFAASSYHLNRYFLAWNNAPATKVIYDQKL